MEAARTFSRRRRRRVLAAGIVGSGELRADVVREQLQIAPAFLDGNPGRRSTGLPTIGPILSHRDSFSVALGRAKEMAARRLIDSDEARARKTSGGQRRHSLIDRACGRLCALSGAGVGLPRPHCKSARMSWRRLIRSNASHFRRCFVCFYMRHRGGTIAAGRLRANQNHSLVWALGRLGWPTAGPHSPLGGVRGQRR